VYGSAVSYEDIHLNDPTVYRTLLESTRAIPWRIDWATSRFTYIGPQIEQLLGWPLRSWDTIQDWADRMHADDRERVVSFCVAQSRAGADHEADYRALTRDGSYVWIRDVVHVIRKADGSPEALVGFMFDVSERKKQEERIVSLQRELMELSFQDGLTGIANRRRFDQTFDEVWHAAVHERTPLGLLMIDIDCFKQFNDAYGHVAGDDCLKRVGQLLGTVATRPRDFLARYGGEEFVLILPNTDEAGTRAVAEACRRTIESARVAHNRSTVGSWLTISVGAGACVPTAAMTAQSLLQRVDKELYRAKAAGRNRVSTEATAGVSLRPSVAS
jgi:diguanylate cyclase (GGDEF)-like protein/PAS domain S-box-containing protein